MKNWFGKILFAILGVIFLLRGGFVLLVGLWRFVLPVMLLGGGIYFIKKALAQKKSLGPKQKPAQTTVRAGSSEAEVIQICPHCLQQFGSCPRCQKART